MEQYALNFALYYKACLFSSAVFLLGFSKMLNLSVNKENFPIIATLNACMVKL